MKRLIWAALALVIIANAASFLLRPAAEVAWLNRPVEPAHEMPVKVGSAATRSTIETNALALDVALDPLAQAQPITLQGGAITIADGQIYILDSMGRTWTYRDGKVDSSGLPDLPMNIAAYQQHARFPLNASTLIAHDIKADPRTGELYASFEAYVAACDSTAFVIAKTLRRPGSTPSWRVVFKSPGLHSTAYYSGRGAGGKLAFAGKTLVFAVGDYNLDSGTNLVAQDPKAFPGKIYVLDLASLKSSRMSIGHRVPQGLVVAADGKVWETEHGPRGGDELNAIVGGANYGWPYSTAGQNYFHYGYVTPGNVAQLAVQAIGRRQRMVQPTYAWVPSVAPTAIVAVHGFDQRWDGDLLVASLKGQSLYRIRLAGDRVLFAEPIWIGHRIRDMIQTGGQIVLWTDDGALLILSPARDLPEGRINREPIYRRPELSACANCHSFSSSAPAPFGPSLKGIYGRNIASEPYAHYSAGLRALSGSAWDEPALTQFLKDPASIAPDTTMPALGLSDEEIARIVAALKADRLAKAQPQASSSISQ